MYTMEPVYSSKCPDFKGFLISGVDFIHICMCICGKTKCPDLKGVRSEGFHCIKYKIQLQL